MRASEEARNDSNARGRERDGKRSWTEQMKEGRGSEEQGRRVLRWVVFGDLDVALGA